MHAYGLGQSASTHWNATGPLQMQKLITAAVRVENGGDASAFMGDVSISRLERRAKETSQDVLKKVWVPLVKCLGVETKSLEGMIAWRLLL